MATEPKKKPRGIRGGVYTEDSGLPPPQDIDSASVTRGPKKAPTPKRAASAQPDPITTSLYDDKSERPDDPLLLARKPNGQIPYYPKTPNKAGAGRGFINPPIPKDAMYAKGGSVGSASRRADGCAQRGKTKGRMM